MNTKTKINKYIIFVIFVLFTLNYIYAQPINDECSSAINLNNLANWCSANSQYGNTGATLSNLSGPACWSSSPSNDVWFQFTAIATAVNVIIRGQGTGSGTLNYPELAMYFGQCLGTMYEIECNEAILPNNGYTSIYSSGLTIGQTYYIRVDGKNNYMGAFQLCINNFSPPVMPGQDCITNSFLCNKNTISQSVLNGGGSDSDEGAGSCLDGGMGAITENNSSWYSWIAANNGTLTFTLHPNNPNDDLDFAVYELPGGNCASKVLLRCEAAYCGPGDSTGLNMSSTDIVEPAGCANGQNNFVKYIDMIVGKTYAILINNYTDNSVGIDNGFSFSFGGTVQFQGPEADFTYTATNYCLQGNSFIFTDNSIGALTYNWNFGSGASLAAANTIGPHTVTYNTSGIKTIVLTVSGTGGCEVITYKQIYISNPSVNLGNDIAICSGNSTILNAGTNYYSYLWTDGSTGQTLSVSNSGNYYVEVTDSVGCVASDTVSVAVNNAVVDIGADIFLCTGNSATLNAGVGFSSYLWSNGEITQTTIIDSTGIYWVKATDINGCIGYDTISVTINSNITSDFNVTSPVCIGYNSTLTYVGNAPPSSNFQWNFDNGTIISGSGIGPYQISWNDTGTYNISLIVSEGQCVSPETSHSVIVSSNPTATFSVNTPICKGESTIVNYSGNADSLATYSWDFDNANIISGTGNGPYELMWQDSGSYNISLTVSQNGCNSVPVSKNVIVNPLPASNFTVVSPICIGNNSVITYSGSVSANAIFQWNFNGGTVASGSGAGPFQVNWNNSGIYNVTLVVNDIGCTSSLTSVPVVVNPQALSTFSVTNPICVTQNSSIVYTGDADTSVSFLWNFNNATVIYGSGSGPYQLNWGNTGSYNISLTIIQDNCASLSTVHTVNVVPLPTSDFTVFSPVCVNEEITISYTGIADSSATFNWNFSNGIIASGSGKGPYQISWNNSGTYNIALVVQNNSECLSQETVMQVSVKAKPVIKFITDIDNGCVPLTVHFFDNSIPVPTNFFWDFGDGGSNHISTDQNPIYTFEQSGVYNVVLTVMTIDSICVGPYTFSKTINVNPIPDVDFYTNPETGSFENSTINFYSTSSNDITNWYWNFNDIASDENYSFQENPFHTFKNPGTFNVSLIASSDIGCLDSVSKKIIIKDIFTFYMPNAFTPDGDNINDSFGPKGRNVDSENYEMYIYDRWGEEIFRSQDVSLFWDGKVKGGKDAPIGVYAWLIITKEIEGRSHAYSGYVTIIK